MLFPEYSFAQEIIQKAFKMDEQKKQKEALALYTKAAEICLELVKIIHIHTQIISNYFQCKNENNPEKISKMKKLAALAIERAEILKAAISPTPCRTIKTAPTAPELTDEEEQCSLIFDENIFPRVPTDGLFK